MDSFCVLPFNHLQVMPSGTCKICCLAQEPISSLDEGKPLSLYENTYEEIWNSSYMQGIREKMVSGEPVKQCQRCYSDENITGQSRRTAMNDSWLTNEKLSDQDVKQQAKESHFIIENNPSFLQLNMGTLCNLKCRMCSGTYSTKIASDPVFSKWSPAHGEYAADIGVWNEDKLKIAPRAIIGIQYKGFYGFAPEIYCQGSPVLASLSFSQIDIPVEQNFVPQYISISLFNPNTEETKVELLINKEPLFIGRIPSGVWEETFDILMLSNCQKLSLSFKGETFNTDLHSEPISFLIKDITITRSPNLSQSSLTNIFFNRFVDNKEWFEQPFFLFGEMLKKPSDIKRLILQGGEPLIIKSTETIIDYLIDSGVAKNVELEFVTNATVVNQKLMQKLKEFKYVVFGCSIDGIESDYEYIRFPAKWHKTSENIEYVRKFGNIDVQFNVAVQLMNLLKIHRLLEYCDRLSINVIAHFLEGPDQLHVLTLPPSARDLAISRLEGYISEQPNRQNAAIAKYMIDYLVKRRNEFFCDHRITTLMMFTNDLDHQNKHRFHDYHPELVTFFEEAGFPWSLKRMYAPDDENQEELNAELQSLLTEIEDFQASKFWNLRRGAIWLKKKLGHPVDKEPQVYFDNHPDRQLLQARDVVNWMHTSRFWQWRVRWLTVKQTFKD